MIQHTLYNIIQATEHIFGIKRLGEHIAVLMYELAE